MCQQNVEKNCQEFRPALVDDCKGWKLCAEGYTGGHLAVCVEVLAEAVNGFVDVLSLKVRPPSPGYHY